MNPRLIKFAVELQNCEKIEERNKKVNFLDLCYKAFFRVLKTEKVPVTKDR